MVLADLTGNGSLDVVTSNYSSNTVSVLLNNGDGTFQPKVDVPVGSEPFAVQAEDFNGDGHPDLAVANSGSNSLSVLLGNGNGTFQAAQNYATGAFPSSVDVGDVNGDGTPDIVTGDSGGDVSVFLNNGDGTFQPYAQYAGGADPSAVLLADLNGDGYPDIVVANNNANSLTILMNAADWGSPTVAIPSGSPAKVPAATIMDQGTGTALAPAAETSARAQDLDPFFAADQVHGRPSALALAAATRLEAHRPADPWDNDGLTSWETELPGLRRS
jgi:hypothetical protein